MIHPRYLSPRSSPSISIPSSKEFRYMLLVLVLGDEDSSVTRLGGTSVQVKIHHCLFQHLLWIEYLRVEIGLFSVTSVVESSEVRLVIVESFITNSTFVRRLSNVSEIGISLVSLIELMISLLSFDLI